MTDSTKAPISEDLQSRYNLARAQLDLIPEERIEDGDGIDKYDWIRDRDGEVIQLIERIAALEAERDDLCNSIADALCIGCEDGEYYIPAEPEPVIVGHSLIEAVKRFKHMTDKWANADEHELSTLRAENAALKAPVSEVWLIHYEDADVDDEVFTGEGAEAAALARFERCLGSWNCQLFMQYLPAARATSPSTTPEEK
jgi:hypothetical protein